MKTLREYIKEAEEKGVAIGHFNISNLEILHGVCNVVKKLDVPVVIGLSEGEEKFVGRNEAVALIKNLREKNDLPIFLNADHHYSFESVKECVDAGFDSVIFDGANLNFEENVNITKQCVDYVKNSNKEILIEGELGYIGSGSNIKDSMPEGVDTKTEPEEAKKFVETTKVDLFSPSVGNIHGLIKTGNPKLDIQRIKEIKESVEIPLVLHGGSGISDEDFKNAIKAGISMIHVSTELRVAYREALEKSLKENSNEIAPYKILEPVVNAIEKVVEARLKLFNGLI